MSPDGAGRTICLCMIVRNESRVIRRALRSVRDLIDYWVVCDTGSTDGTPAIVLDCLSGIPGELHRTEWVNFGHNRGEALRLARGHADYSLILDADMAAVVTGPFKHKLSCDWYELRYQGALDYSQPMLLSSEHEWDYVGVTHEYVRSPTASTGAELPELSLVHFGDGGMRGDKYERDIRLLEEANAAEPGDHRTLFYLAQSYWDAGDTQTALGWYERRIACDGGWEEERWYARLRAAQARQALGRPDTEVLAAFLAAYAARPSRFEPLYELAHAARLRGDFALGYMFAAAAEGAPYPSDRLFIERDVHTWRLTLERALCAFGTGRLSGALRAFTAVLDTPDVPDWAADAAIRGLGRVLGMMDPGPPGDVPPGDDGQNRIKVVVAFRNPGHFLDNCVESLLAQDFGRFEIIFVDDASDDDVARQLPLADPRVRYLRNPRRLGAAGSTYRALTECCEPGDIVVHVDGDDWLACDDALSYIDEQYRRHCCWVMYGQFQWSTGEYGLCRPFASAGDFGRLRETWVLSHVKTYRAGLFYRIADTDPGYTCLKDGQGRWLDASVDAALMFPLAELAGFERTRYNDRVLYVYNSCNPASVHRERLVHQTAVYQELQQRRRFTRVDELRPARGPELVR